MKHRFVLGTLYTLVFALCFSFGLASAQEEPPPPPDLLSVTVDIKPGSCTNLVNVKCKGVIPIAVMGSEAFPFVEGVIPAVSFVVTTGETSFEWTPQYLKVGYDDVTGPNGDCRIEDPDEILDLLVKVRTQELVGALTTALTGAGSELVNGQTVKLALKVDGLAQGEDTLMLHGVKKPKKPKRK